MTPNRWSLEMCISADYPGRPRVLDHAELNVRKGEVVGLVGSSGSGKSSLALALLRLLELKGGRVSGEIRFEGKDLMRSSERAMRSIRGREISFVPQSPLSYLNPAMPIKAQLVEAWKAHQKGSRAETQRTIRWAVEQVGLPSDDSFLNRYPGQVSVGQAQRVLIAMAILHNPVLLIADEPTSSLDTISRAEVLDLFARLNRQLGMAILYISHDLLSISGFCDRVAILHEGRVVEFADTGSIFDSPRHPFTRRLTDAMPAMPRSASSRGPVSIPA